VRDYHQLEIWQRAMAYAVRIYEFASRLPEEERFNLIFQVRKAVTSVPLNIAEGSGCSTDREFARFLGYSYRSLKEVISCVELCERLFPSIPSSVTTSIVDEGNQLSRMTRALIERLASAVDVWEPPPDA
jgi:four helix bundle protein